jgi:hypothetical protein
VSASDDVVSAYFWATKMPLRSAGLEHLSEMLEKRARNNQQYYYNIWQHVVIKRALTRIKPDESVKTMETRDLNDINIVDF